MDSKYSIWLHKSSVKGKAYCFICNKDSGITNMVIAALNSQSALVNVDNVASRALRSSAFFGCKKQNASIDTKPVQQFKPWLYQQVLLMQKCDGH